MSNSRAEQPIVIGVFYVRCCELLNETRLNLTPDATQHHLELAQQKLFHEVPFGPPVIDSRTLTQFQPDPQMQLVTGIGYDDVQFQPANLTYTDEGTGGQLVDHHIDTVDKSSDYLRKTPYVVTDANKDFVMIKV